MLPSSYKTPLFWGILVAGIFLRFHALDRQSLWDDEMSTLHTISTPASQFIHRFATYETHPPLYFLQLRLWQALHLRSLVKLRANSALWGSLSLLLAYIVGRRYGGESLGILTLAFLAFSPFHLAYSQELRPYAMAVAISLASVLALERRSWMVLGFFWTAQLYTHYWGAFVVLAQASYAFLYFPHERKRVFRAAGAAGLLFLLWVPVLAAQLGIIDQHGFWVPAFSVASLGKVFLAYSGLVFNMAGSIFYLPARVWVHVLLGFVFAMLVIEGFRKGPRLAILWLAVGLLVPWLLSAWKASVFVWYRYTIHMLPAFALLIASGLLSLKKGSSEEEKKGKSLQNKFLQPFFPFSLLRTILVALVLGSQVWGDWIYFHNWQKANPKGVVQYVHWLRKPNTIVVRPAYFAELFGFYDRDTTATIDQNVLDSPEKRAALKGHDILLLAFDVPSDPISDALLAEFKPESARYFPGTAHLGITVYQLK